jgi:Right handed beta helix region
MRRIIPLLVVMTVGFVVVPAIAMPSDFCVRHPNHWKCRPVSTTSPPATPTQPPTVAPTITTPTMPPPVTTTTSVTTTSPPTISVAPTITTPTMPPPVTTTTSPPTTCILVVAPASIQAAIDANPPGVAFCLSGTFTVTTPILPKDGNAFLGPAVITGPTSDMGFALTGVDADNVTFDNLEMYGFLLRAIEVWDFTVIRNSYIHHNLRNGIGGGGSIGVLIENNEIAFNGSLQYLGIAAGGVKLALSGDHGRGPGSVIRGNYVHDNVGNGLWCDVDCQGDLFEGNRVEFNTRAGIHYEISLGLGVIRGNVANFNNTSGNNPSAGLYTNSSEHVLIENNQAIGNIFHDINVRDDSREYSAPFAITVRNNDVTPSGEVDGCTIAGVVCSGNT